MLRNIVHMPKETYKAEATFRNERNVSQSVSSKIPLNFLRFCTVSALDHTEDTFGLCDTSPILPRCCKAVGYQYSFFFFCANLHDTVLPRVNNSGGMQYCTVFQIIRTVGFSHIKYNNISVILLI